MQFAHFAHVWGKTGMSPAERYRQLWREIQVADELNFDYAFCVEHHFSPHESWMSAPNLYAASVAARTRRIRMGAMGHVVPLHHPIRLVEEIALTDQIVEGRLEVGLVPGVLPAYFEPFNADFGSKRETTLEFVAFLKAAYAGEGGFSFSGRFHRAKDVVLSVMPAQRPHPPLWLETRDPPTLAFCAREGLNTGYFITFPRKEARRRYGRYLADWKASGWTRTPKIAYSTVVYVSETDGRAIDKALLDASTAYRGFFGNPKNQTEFKRAQAQLAELHEQKNDPEGADIIRNLLNADYLLDNDLVLIGSPQTVVRKLRQWADEGLFNTFFGEFNFGDLAEEDVLNSIRLFGEAVIPSLRDYEPFH
jgi:alkanesulfonate monooxygenase SsuD/methylene tetrahydromethanopterin reductase-like flavin-dependent oxidoreductase (luciferase family)